MGERQKRLGAPRAARVAAERQTKIESPTKQCSTCGKTKPKSGFFASNTSVDGLLSQCK
jgi:hypothetical protein